MSKLLEIIDQLLPLSVTIILIVFVYLANLYRQILEKRIEQGKESHNDLKQSIEVTVKITELYKDEIRLLENKIQGLKSDYKELSDSIDSNMINFQSQKKLADTNRSSEFLTTINVAQLPNFEAFLNILHNHGYNACSIRKNSDEDLQPEFIETEQQTVWIGGNIPSITAINIIKLASNHWPFLKYVYLTHDLKNIRPEIHSILFIGGNTVTAQNLGLREWTKSDFELLSENWTQTQFHEFIRNTSKGIYYK